MRIAGITIGLVSLALSLFGAVALWQTQEMAATLGQVADGRGDVFDAGNWAWHWRVSSAVFLLTGIAGVMPALGLVRRRRWGLALWCGLITSLLLGQIATNVGGLAKYPFEYTGRIEMTVVAAMCVASWFALSRVPNV